MDRGKEGKLSSKPVVITLIGPPASGKETQARLLAQQLGFTLVTLNQLLRQLSQESSSTGRKLQKLIKHGSIISADVIKPVIESLISQINMPGVVIVGFPRTVEQAELLVNLRGQCQRILVIEIKLTDALIGKRIHARVEQAGEIQSTDDDIALVEDKMILYNASKTLIQQTLVAKVLDSKNLNYFQVDGSQTPELIHQTILNFVRQDTGV